MDHYQTRGLTREGIALTVKTCSTHAQAPFPGGSGNLRWQQPWGAAAKPGGTATTGQLGRSLQAGPSGSRQRHFPEQFVWGQRQGSGVWHLPPAKPGAPCPLQPHTAPQRGCSHVPSTSTSFKCASLIACNGLSEELPFVYVKWNLPEAHSAVFPEKAIVWVITIPENTRQGRFYVLSLT